MARSEDEIALSMKNTVQSINPTVDLKVGPTYDYTLRPVPKELAFVETTVDRMTSFYSAALPNVATAAEARDFATNFGVSASPGERSSGTVVFFRNSPPQPNSTLFIPSGLIVGTRDSKFLFQTVEAKLMLGDFADTYFNPITNKYELEVLIEAVTPGVLYDLPVGRINQIISGDIDFDGIDQRNPTSGGTEPEDSVQLVTRTIQQFKGVNLNSIAGIATMARRFIPTGISDLKVIRPSDRLEFRRLTSGPALDLCVKGVEERIFQEEFFALGGETFVTLTNTTATSITQVRVNDEVLDFSQWTFVPDTSKELGGSTRAKSQIQFFSPLGANDVVDIIGNKNNMLDKLQLLFSAQDDAIFQTDIMVRSFVDLPVVIGIELKVKNSPLIDLTEIQTTLDTVVKEFVEPTLVPESLSPADLKDAIREIITDVDSIRIFDFRRKLKSIDTVEIITPLKNELPRFDSNSSRLIVRS